METPSHKHDGQTQIILSLGTTRTLIINSKKYDSNNGDIFIFGSQIHSIPKEHNITDGRISIALFTQLQ